METLYKVRYSPVKCESTYVLDFDRVNMNNYSSLLKSYNWEKLPNSGEALVISGTKQYPKGYLWQT